MRIIWYRWVRWFYDRKVHQWRIVDRNEPAGTVSHEEFEMKRETSMLILGNDVNGSAAGHLDIVLWHSSLFGFIRTAHSIYKTLFFLCKVMCFTHFAISYHFCCPLHSLSQSEAYPIQEPIPVGKAQKLGGKYMQKLFNDLNLTISKYENMVLGQIKIL